MPVASLNTTFQTVPGAIVTDPIDTPTTTETMFKAIKPITSSGRVRAGRSPVERGATALCNSTFDTRTGTNDIRIRIILIRAEDRIKREELDEQP